MGALAVLAGGVLVGAWAPWQADDTVAARPTTTLPQDPIIPPGIPDTTVPEPAPPGDDFGFGPGLESFDDLREFLEEQFRDGPGGDFSFDFQGLILPDSIPEEYQITSQSLQVTPQGLRESLRLEGPGGTFNIVAVLEPDAELPDGEPVDVRGTSGVVVDEPGGVSLTWIEGGRVDVTITAPSGTEVQRLLDLAEALEVAP